MTQTTKASNIISLDVGEKRVGVALANSIARLPQPYCTLERGAGFWNDLGSLLIEQAADTVVIGLPRSLEGNDTAQTEATRSFIDEFKGRFAIAVAVQDEALTSRQAEEALRARGKVFSKGDIDALAATYILEDYLNTERPTSYADHE